MKRECVIGVWWDYEDSCLVNADELEEVVTEHNKWIMPDRRVEPIEYCDRRRSLNLTRFNYCPVCGEKIDWNKLKKRFKKRKASPTD